jgi:hypothetical protein
MPMCEEDEWGNTWMDDAVPGGIEIAHVMLEIRQTFGWTKMWANYDGLRICPRVRVWLDGYQDLDYHEAFLLRVWTNYGDDADHVTTADHLAVYSRHGKPTVAWREQPRLFFDGDSEWLFDGIRWWVDWTQTEAEYRDPETTIQLSQERLDRIAEHNRTVTQRDRDSAVRLGLGPALPYLRNVTE